MARTASGFTIETSIELETIECGRCGIVFGMPGNLVQRRREDHATFYCPNGDPRAYLAESAAEKAQRELRESEERHRREIEAERQRRIRAQNDAMDLANENRALKSAATVACKRAAAGVCAFCNRTFKNVTRHVTSRHPSEGHPKAVGVDALAAKTSR